MQSLSSIAALCIGIPCSRAKGKPEPQGTEVNPQSRYDSPGSGLPVAVTDSMNRFSSRPAKGGPSPAGRQRRTVSVGPVAG